MDSPDFAAPVTTLGPFARASATPIKPLGNAPKLGEHNSEIYERELGLSHAEVVRLASAGVP